MSLSSVMLDSVWMLGAEGREWLEEECGVPLTIVWSMVWSSEDSGWEGRGGSRQVEERWNLQVCGEGGIDSYTVQTHRVLFRVIEWR